jgi:hypothetical protein
MALTMWLPTSAPCPLNTLWPPNLAFDGQGHQNGEGARSTRSSKQGWSDDSGTDLKWKQRDRFIL